MRAQSLTGSGGRRRRGDGPRRATAKPARSPGEILVVDDNPANLLAIEAALGDLALGMHAGAVRDRGPAPAAGTGLRPDPAGREHAVAGRLRDRPPDPGAQAVPAHAHHLRHRLQPRRPRGAGGLRAGGGRLPVQAHRARGAAGQDQRCSWSCSAGPTRWPGRPSCCARTSACCTSSAWRRSGAAGRRSRCAGSATRPSARPSSWPQGRGAGGHHRGEGADRAGADPIQPGAGRGRPAQGRVPGGAGPRAAQPAGPAGGRAGDPEARDRHRRPSERRAGAPAAHPGRHGPAGALPGPPGRRPAGRLAHQLGQDRAAQGAGEPARGARAGGGRGPAGAGGAQATQLQHRACRPSR